MNHYTAVCIDCMATTAYKGRAKHSEQTVRCPRSEQPRDCPHAGIVHQPRGFPANAERLIEQLAFVEVRTSTEE